MVRTAVVAATVGKNYEKLRIEKEDLARSSQLARVVVTADGSCLVGSPQCSFSPLFSSSVLQGEGDRLVAIAEMPLAFDIDEGKILLRGYQAPIISTLVRHYSRALDERIDLTAIHAKLGNRFAQVDKRIQPSKRSSLREPVR